MFKSVLKLKFWLSFTKAQIVVATNLMVCYWLSVYHLVPKLDDFKQKIPAALMSIPTPNCLCCGLRNGIWSQMNHILLVPVDAGSKQRFLEFGAAAALGCSRDYGGNNKMIRLPQGASSYCFFKLLNFPIWMISLKPPKPVLSIFSHLMT